MEKKLQGLFFFDGNTDILKMEAYTPSEAELVSVRGHLMYWKVEEDWVVSVLLFYENAKDASQKKVLVRTEHPHVPEEVNEFSLYFDIGANPALSAWSWKTHLF